MSWEEWLKLSLRTWKVRYCFSSHSECIHTSTYMNVPTYTHTYICMYTNGRIYLVLFHGCMCSHTGVSRCIYSYFSDLFKCYCDWVDSAYRQTWIFSKVLFLIFYKQQIRKKMFLPHSQKVNEFFVVFYGLAATWKFSPSLTPGKSFRNTKADAVSLVLKAPPPDFFL